MKRRFGQKDGAEIRSKKIRRLTVTGLLFACAIVLSVIESSLPLLSPIPGVKLGLSNIAVMYALFFVGGRNALSIAALKGLFVLAVRGVTAGLLSLGGGLLSVGAMLLLQMIFKKKISYFMLSVFGAVLHNAGQLAVASLLMNTPLFGYFPVLFLSGIAAGITTSVLLRVTFPVLRKLNFNKF